MADTIMELLQRLRDSQPNNREAAKILGLSESRFGRALRGEGGSLNVVRCFKLAIALKENPEDVLRAAGKSDLADLIARTYKTAQRPYRQSEEQPKERRVVVPPDLLALITNWSQLDDVHRRLARDLAEIAASAFASRRRKPSRSSRAADSGTVEAAVSQLSRDLGSLDEPSAEQPAHHPRTRAGGEKK